MFHKGDVVLYSAHGICRIDDICDLTFLGTTRTYYVLHPLEDPELTVNIPKDQASEKIKELLNKEEAESIIDSFDRPGIDWIQHQHQRARTYQNLIRTENRRTIAQILNTLLLKKHEAEQNDKKLGQADLHMLTSIQNALFAELAVSLQSTPEDIEERVTDRIKLQMQHDPAVHTV